MRKPRVTIYTDGSAKPTGAGGYAGLLESGCHREVVTGGSKLATNNQMELTAVIESVKILDQPCNVRVVSDSQYVVNSINGWIKSWKNNDWITKGGTPVANVELMQQISNQMTKHRIKAKWVKGHHGHEANELADQLADIEARMQTKVQ